MLIKWPKSTEIFVVNFGHFSDQITFQMFCLSNNAIHHFQDILIEIMIKSDFLSTKIVTFKLSPETKST